MRKQVKTFDINGRDVNLDAVWYEGNDPEALPPDEFEIYDEDGTCLNEGDPWFEEPDEQVVKDYIYKWFPEYEPEDYQDLRDEEDSEDRSPVRTVPKPRDL